MVLIKENYRKRGANIPCTLNSQFKSSSSVFPKCVINLMDAIHNDVVIRVVGLQDLNTGNEYKISIDDFNNPDMVAMTLEKTHPFSICIRYHNF